MTAFSQIPAELRELDSWVVWRWETRDGKPTKPPYRVDDPSQHASSTKPETWGKFEQAVELVENGKADGIGFALAPPYVGVDLDAELSANEQYAILLALESYAEVSPSGDGHHVIVKAHLNGDGRHPVGLGVFQTGRFFYCTGEHVRGTPETIEERQAALEVVIAEYLPKQVIAADSAPGRPVDLDDRELLERAFAARNGEKVRRLWEGDWSGYSSQSEGDLALLTHLAFWTNLDAGRMEAMFQRSGLYREEGPTKPKGIGYLARTIRKAIESTSDVYESPRDFAPRLRPDFAPKSPRSSPPSPSEKGEVETSPATSPRLPHSWAPLDLVTRRANPPAPPEIVGLFYPGYNHLVSGESEALKTWLELIAAATELKSGRGVLWVDGDDVGEGALLERLRLLGVDDDVTSRLFAYVLPDEPLDEARRADVLEVVRARSCRLAVLDGFNPLLVLHGFNPDSGADVEKFYRLIAPIRKAPTAIVLSDNVVKAREARGAWAIGSERKKSKAEVHLGMRALVPLVRGGTGKAKIEVHKDRPGHLERPSPGVLVIESDDTRCSWEIRPDESRDAGGEFRPTALMEKVSRYLELQPEPCSRNQVEEMKLGKRDYVRIALDRLIAEGFATEFEGPRRARLIRLERRFREDEDEQA